MEKRPLPESEELERQKRNRRVTRAVWIGVVILGVLLVLFFLLAQR